MGVCAVKIEGRMKSGDYVRTVVSVYRRAIDSYYTGDFKLSKNDLKELEESFNRSFTGGFFSNEKNIVAPETPTNRSEIVPVRKYSLNKLTLG